MWNLNQRKPLFAGPLGIYFLLVSMACQGGGGSGDTSAANAREPLKTPAPVTIEIKISTKEFEVDNPLGKATLECVLTNNTDAPINLPRAYDTRMIAIFGQGEGHVWALVLGPIPWTEDQTHEGLGAGVSRSILKVELRDILPPEPRRADGTERWYWSWTAHPRPPISPINDEWKEGYVQSADFWATLSIGKSTVMSQKIHLKVVRK